jgi:glycosyltransferase involved in cell wall biosynthesis
MIRVLHLFGRQSTFQAEHGVSLLTDPTSQTFQSASLTIGRGGDFRSTLGAGANLRFSHSDFDLIHAWDAQAFIAAVVSGLPVVFSPSQRFGRGTWSWLAAAAYHDVQVVSATKWGCARRVSEGLGAERCNVIVPGYEAPERSLTADSDLRARLGILPSQFVILAPGESARAAHHRVAWHAAAILRVLDERFRLLIWGRGAEARLVRDLSAKVKQPELVVDAEKRLGRDVSFDELVWAADVALFTGSSDASALPLAACAAAGLPIVATESAVVRELFLADDVVIVPRKDVRTLSQRLLELKESPARREILGAKAKGRAEKAFDAGRFVRECGELYLRVLERHRGVGSGAPGLRESVAALV